MPLTNDQLDEIREAFSLFDSDNRGVIDIRELRASLRALGFDVKKEDIVNLLHNIGKNINDNTTANDIKITIDDFISICQPLMSTRDTQSEIEKIFKLFDTDNTGYITYRSLKRVVSELGENLSDNDIQEMIDQADRSGQGKINLQDFTRIMKKRTGNPLDDWDSDDD